MVQQKLYKTKLCVLYQRGHCHRQTCSFAHGDSDLRRFSATLGGRRDYRGSDLRDKLDRRRSPLQRYSPGRGARDRHASHGYSPPRSLRKRRKHRKETHLDGQSDFSGSLKTSDGAEDQVKHEKPTSSDLKDVFDEQLRQVQSEIDMLDDHKHQLEIYLEERVQEVDSLTSKIVELEMQFCREKEECKRISSKIKKFIRAHNHHSWIQDELKRSQTRLQKLGDQLGSDARIGTNEEDSSINILSDGENTGNHVISPQNELQKKVSPSKKRLRIHLEADEESKQGNPTKGTRFMLGTIRRPEKLPGWNVHCSQYFSNEEAETPIANNDNPNPGKNTSIDTSSADKWKGFESGVVLPSTGMAAHAVDEVVEMEEKFEVFETASRGVEKGASVHITGLSFRPPPLPPVPQNVYSQYEGDDENVDVEGLDEDTVDVDIV